MSVPGEHELAFRQTGYIELTAKAILEPEQKENYIVRMEPDPQVRYPTEIADVKISVWPKITDGRFVGHVAESDGIGKRMLLSPGKHRFKVTLPGCKSFATETTLGANQEV